MAQKLSAAQRRYIENALLIAALGLTFKKLEEDYETKLLGDIADTTSGGTPLRNISTYYGGDIPWIKSGELNDNVIESAEEFITEEGLANSSAKIYPKGTLVVALYGATVGKTGILGFDAASNQAVCAVFPKTQEVTNEFIFWFLRHKRPEFLGMSFGGAQPNISQKIIRETHIPIPSLELQKTLSAFFALVEKRQNGNTNQKYPTLPDEFSDVLRTVVLIESLAARVNEAQRLREEAEIETEKLLLSARNELFTKLDFEEVELGSVVLRANNGFGRRPKSEESGPIVLRLADVSTGKVSLASPRRVEMSEKEYEQYKVEQGDLIFVRVNGSLPIVGRCIYCEFDADEKVAYNDHLIRAKINLQKLDPKYAMLWINSPDLRRLVESRAITTAGQYSISQTSILSLPIKLPPLDEQRRIVAYLDGLQAKVNALRELQVKGGEELSALMPSILDKAFRGEL